MITKCNINDFNLYILLLFLLLQNISGNNNTKTTITTSTSTNNTVLNSNLTEFDEFNTSFTQKSTQIVQTTTLLTTTTTSTTTTTTKPISIAFINDFNLTEISYDNVFNTIKLGYLLKANFSLNNAVYSPPIMLEIKINCSSLESNQFWFRSIKGQLVVTSLTFSTTRMAPYNIEPIPGSFINCTATIVDLNQFKTFHSSNYLLNSPLPVLGFESVSLNETSIQLQWSNPTNSSFSSIELRCSLNETLIFELTIHSNALSSYTIGNLVPGTLYSCFITLIKEANSLIARSKTLSTIQMTNLSQAVLIGKGIVENDLIQFKFKPPQGNYDFYRIQLVSLNSDLNDTDSTVVRAKTYNSKKEEQNIVIFDNNLNETTAFDESIKIKSGFVYELWTETSIYRSNMTTYVKRVKLTNSAIIIKPAKINNLIIYALADRALNITWRNPTGRFNKFLINIYSADNLYLIDSFTTIKSSIVISNLTNLNHLITVATCVKLHNDCDTISSSVNKTFSFQSRKIANFNVRNYNTGQFLSRTASLYMTWNLNISESERCDISRFHLQFTDFNKASSNECFTKPIRIYLPNCLNMESNVQFKECDQFDKLNCYLFNNQINCSFNLNGLNFNTDYNISLTVMSKTGDYEWPVHNSATIHTDISVPSSLKTFQLLTNTQLGSDTMINIIQPYIDESNGAIYESYLYLVYLGTVVSTSNQTHVNNSYQIDLIDQDHLNNLIDKQLCSNETGLYEPCLLKKYSNHENDFRQERPVFIGSLNSLHSQNLTGIFYENITTDLIKPMSYYQLFYIFKIRNNFKNNILFAINPSEPIKTHAFSNSALLNQTYRDGMALWIVVVISITSSLLLLTIITALVTLIVVKYKPKSRFRKAAQIVSQPLNSHGCASRSNLKSAIETSSKTTFNDYTGMFMNDFIEPTEFSKYDMTNIWLVKHANGDLILDEEYRNLPDFRNSKTCFASQSHKNEIKNRFLDIKAYDDSRVVLDVSTYCNNNYATLNKKSDTNSQSSVDKSILSSMSTSTSSNNSIDLEHHLNSDYINANFIQGFSHENKFIATQGPKKETINDFWLMIWQYRVTAIVMLTKLVEKGVERCTQYWPDKLNISEMYGDFEITMKDQQKCGDYLKRTFELIYSGKQNVTTITMTPGSTINGNKRLMVTQYYYPEWPDKDTPSTDPMSILHLIRDVNLNHLKYQYPIVVHCSAGVGRTGTYITLDAMMEKINLEGKIDIFGFISKIRERRQYLVQTSKQYVFIHEALYEYCLYGFTDVETSRLVAHYKNLNDLSPTNALGIAYQNSNKTRLQIEFEKINNAFAPNSQAREAFSSDNKHRNRYLNTICYDENRIKLSGLNGSTYINGTKIKGYEAHNEIIITQDPMFNTVFEFWKMITEYDCNIVVCLNKDFEFETESIYWPTVEEPVKTFECEDLKFVVQLAKTNKISTDDLVISQYMTKRELEITEYKYGSITKVNVTHIMYNEIWPEDRAPLSRTAFLELVGQVQKTAAKNERSNVAVHAHGGGSNCSVFCSLIYLLDQFKNDQYVDVCRLVKKLKTQRPHMVETFEQYQFLYQCLIDFVDMFGIYSQSSGSFHSRNSLTDSLYRKSPTKECSDLVANLNHVKLNL